MRNSAIKAHQDTVDGLSNLLGMLEQDKEDTEKPFLMPVDGVFTIQGRGTVVTGTVVHGTIKVQEEVEIIGFTNERRKVVVTSIEMLFKFLDQATAGDNVALALRGLARTDVERGQVLAKPGSIKPHTKFTSQA